MSNAYFHVPKPVNEPVLSHAAGTPERAALRAQLRDEPGVAAGGER